MPSKLKKPKPALEDSPALPEKPFLYQFVFWTVLTAALGAATGAVEGVAISRHLEPIDKAGTLAASLITDRTLALAALGAVLGAASACIQWLRQRFRKRAS